MENKIPIDVPIKEFNVFNLPKHDFLRIDILNWYANYSSGALKQCFWHPKTCFSCCEIWNQFTHYAQDNQELSQLNDNFVRIL